MRAFHFLQTDMRSGSGAEPAWEVGETRTLPEAVRIIPCSSGYHASPSLWDALKYAPGPIACLVEVPDDAIPHGEPIDKYAARSRRLIEAANIERGLRLFAADCAEHVLWIYERDHPDDGRPRAAIEVARAYADGRISAAARSAAEAARSAAEAARAAAGAAAWAAGDAAGDAAEAASWAARSAAEAARADARADADADADAASWAAWDAEVAWQRAQFEQRFAGLFAEVPV